MDLERVYSSDQKKMIRWFDELKKNNIEIKLSEVPEEPETEEPELEEVETPEAADKKPAAKTKTATKKKEAKTPVKKKK